MPNKTKAPYGTWPSPISASLVAGNSVRLSEARYFDGSLYWLESRPQEGGRSALVRLLEDGKSEDVVPVPHNVRSRVHEYGGGAYTVWAGSVYFVDALDQQIYACPLDTRKPTRLTDMPGCRFADLLVAPEQGQLIAVREDHSGDGLPTGSLVALSLGADAAAENLRTLADGHDFFASAAISPCSRWLCYLTWDHPNMPWDNNQLWLCPLSKDGNPGAPVCIAGNGEESLFQPQFSPGGALFWVSDRSDWWNLYCLQEEQLSSVYRQGTGGAKPSPVCTRAAEFATPHWQFGMSTYAFLDAETIFATYTEKGIWHLAKLHKPNEAGSQWRLESVASDLRSAASVTAKAGEAALIGATAFSVNTVYCLQQDALLPVGNSAPAAVAQDEISVAEALEFATADGGTGHAFFYPPLNAGFAGSDDSLPPLITLCHGGPTGATDASLSYKIQFWTNRGFAVLDVNYRGSTGYGRAYRHALQGQWGILDVSDLVDAADYVTARGWVHPSQRIIRGGSAGGYTVLAALTDTQAFNAGVSLYGIGDLETLARDTHKFEARYLDGLIGPYPAAKDVYIARSPIHKVRNIRCPVLVFQGLQDKVVPPNQAEAVVEAVRQQGLPVAYVTYADEAHGFRKAETICHQLNAELYFYQKVFGLGATDEGPAPITIDNL